MALIIYVVTAVYFFFAVRVTPFRSTFLHTQMNRAFHLFLGKAKKQSASKRPFCIPFAQVVFK